MSYDRYDSRRRRPLYSPATSSRRSTLGYWVPLVLTVTVATAGLAAWIWSERQEAEDDEEYTSDEHGKPDYPPRPPEGYQPDFEPPPDGQYPGPPPSSGFGTGYGGPPGTEGSRNAAGEEDSFMSRVQGVVRRTPSPQQFFDSAGSRIAAGMAAAGAAVGGALGSIREEEGSGKRKEVEEGFSDHERWSEEAESKRVEAQSGESAAAVSSHVESFNASVKAGSSSTATGKSKARRTVAVVVSAETSLGDQQKEDVEHHSEHASILSHLPYQHDPSTTRLFILIYAPHLTTLPPLPATSTSRAPSALSSSYASITDPAQTPADDLPEPHETANPPNRYFDALCNQALTLVEHPSMIMPFTTPTGYIHMLRHLAPNLVYLSDTPALSGVEGGNVSQLRGWVGQTVVVVGDEGFGGLVDTETETEDEGGKERQRRSGGSWWEGSEMVGLGKGVEVVDAGRVGEDWGRRVVGRE